MLYVVVCWIYIRICAYTLVHVIHITELIEAIERLFEPDVCMCACVRASVQVISNFSASGIGLCAASMLIGYKYNSDFRIARCADLDSTTLCGLRD